MPLSVVIPSFRRADLLRDCLRSVQAHAPRKTQVIVVDDASPGGCVRRAALEFPGVECVRLPRQSGFCVAANRGIALARGGIVELLNDDTQVQPGWAGAALRAFENPLVGAVAPLVLLGPVTEAVPRVDSAGDVYDRGGFAWKRGHSRRLCDALRRRCLVPAASGAAAFYRRDLLLQLGGFEESFGAYFEDVDLSLRIGRAGYRILFEPDSRVWHLCGSSYRRRDRRVLQMQSRNEERLFWRGGSPREVLAALPRHLAVLAGKAALRIREGALLPFLLGRLQALAESLPLARSARRPGSLTPPRPSAA